MSERVSVNAEALTEFIDNARSDMRSFMSEFCCTLAEMESEQAMFDDLVTALDVREIPG